MKDLHELVKDTSCLITVVFDSSDPTRDHSSKGNFKSLEIVFTPKKQTADEYIIEALDYSRNPRNVTVVTLDRELADKCMLRGAAVLSMKEFFTLFTKKKSKKSSEKNQEQAFKKLMKESPSQVTRLLTLFEKRLLDDLMKD